MDNITLESMLSVKSTLDIAKYWNSNMKISKRKESVSYDNVTDEVYTYIKNLVKNMRNSESFSSYIKYFKEFCRVAKIPSNNIIIVKYEISKGKEKNKNHFSVQYSTTKKKIIIPTGYNLYHMSKVAGIKELKPQFKGKSERGYLYDKPRVYLTIHKEMPKICADYKQNVTMYKYVCEQNIRTAYVDPLLPFYQQGAVFIETNTPIKVKEITNNIKEIEKMNVEHVEDVSIEPKFTSLQEFVEYYGLILIDDNDEYVSESISSKLGEITRNAKDSKSIKNYWNNIANKFKRNAVEIPLNDKEYIDMVYAYKKVKEDNISFNEYMKYFKKIATFAKLSVNDIILEDVSFFKRDEKKYMRVRYSKGKQKIIIPNGTCLTHMSPVDNLTELKSSFRSKIKGKYMYPSKRIYFTLSKEIKPSKDGLENTKTYKYTPIDDIKTAYIDPACTSYSMGTVYVDTPFSIKVTKFINKMKKKFMKESFDNIDKAKLAIYEAFYDKQITESEKDELIEILNDKIK